MTMTSDISNVRPFDGIVNVRFRGAVIASSERALVGEAGDGELVHLVPFKDVNFELLAETGCRSGDGTLSFWDVVAEGERLGKAVAVFETAGDEGKLPVAHAMFLSDEFDQDIMTADEKALRVSDWPK